VEKECENFTWTSSQGIKVQTDIIKVGSHASVIVPKAIGIKINDYLGEHFEEMISSKFTAMMEDKLDHIAEGESAMVQVLDEFWGKLKDMIEVARSKPSTQKQVIESEHKVFDICDQQYQVRHGLYGPVIEKVGAKSFTTLKPFMTLTKKHITDVTKEDVELLLSLPITLPKVPHVKLSYARYGFYITDTQSAKHYSIFPSWIRGTFHAIEPVQLLTMDKAHVDEIIGYRENAAATEKKTVVTTGKKTVASGTRKQKCLIV
jgi:hypothetical protein